MRTQEERCTHPMNPLNNILTILDINMQKTIQKFILVALLLFCGTAWSSQKVTYFHTDNVGSPIAATDESGAVIWREEYRPYGERLLNDPASADNETWYAGKRHDDYVKLTYSQARWYDPEVGRFMGIDPVEFQEANIQSFNRYTYSNNNPYKFVDPDGRELEPIHNVATVTNKGGVKMRTILVDAKAKNRAFALIRIAKEHFGMTLNNAFRIQLSSTINTTNPTAEGFSRHNAGFGLDFNQKALSEKQYQQFSRYAAALGFEKEDSSDRPHWSLDPQKFGYASKEAAVAENRKDLFLDKRKLYKHIEAVPNKQ